MCVCACVCVCVCVCRSRRRRSSREIGQEILRRGEKQAQRQLSLQNRTMTSHKWIWRKIPSLHSQGKFSKEKIQGRRINKVKCYWEFKTYQDENTTVFSSVEMVMDIAARDILKDLWELKPHCSRPLNEYKIRKQGDEETGCWLPLQGISLWKSTCYIIARKTWYQIVTGLFAFVLFFEREEVEVEHV